MNLGGEAFSQQTTSQYWLTTTMAFGKVRSNQLLAVIGFDTQLHEERFHVSHYLRRVVPVMPRSTKSSYAEALTPSSSDKTSCECCPKHGECVIGPRGVFA